MNIRVGEEWDAFIKERVNSGRNSSASEVVREGLLLLQQQEQLRQVRLDEVRRKVNEGLDALDRGEYIELDEDGLRKYMEDVNRRGRERLASKQARAGG